MDFDVASIDVNEGTLNWGPLRFNFKGALPDPVGDPIASAAVKSYLNGEETTDDLIAQASHEPTAVLVWLSYPGEDLHGKHTLEFKLTTQDGGQNTFTFGFVHVQQARIA